MSSMITPTQGSATTWLRSSVGALVLPFAVLAFAGSVAAQGPDLPEPHPDLPEDFQQLLPRGRIAAVDEPVMIPAAKAEISDDAWILGVEVDGAAHAYSLNLLNRHEVVNDRLGDLPIAAVW